MPGWTALLRRQAGTLPTLGSVATLVDFERRFKRALDATPFGCYPAMLLDVYEGTVGWSETDINFVEKGWRHVQAQMSSTRTSSSLLLALSGNPNELYKAQTRAAGDSKALLPTIEELLGYREQVLALTDLLGKAIQRCVPNSEVARLDAIVSGRLPCRSCRP